MEEQTKQAAVTGGWIAFALALLSGLGYTVIAPGEEPVSPEPVVEVAPLEPTLTCDEILERATVNSDKGYFAYESGGDLTEMQEANGKLKDLADAQNCPDEWPSRWEAAGDDLKRRQKLINDCIEDSGDDYQTCKARLKSE